MNYTVSDSDIPQSFTASVDRPFDPIGKRDLYNAQFDRNNQRLTQEEIRQLLDAPPSSPEPTRAEKMTKEANTKTMAEFESLKFYNLSIKEILFRTSDVVHMIIDDLLDFDPRDGIRGFLDIFTKGDRLVYMGLITMIVGLFVLLIRTTESYDVL